MIKRILYFVAPLLSLVLATLANGLFTTLVTLRAHNQGASSWMIGLMVGLYYAGMALGSFRSERFIARVGHIRAYAAIASVLAVVSLLQGLIANEYISFLLRFISGFCVAGIYIVIESWLMASSSKVVRGRILAVYMVALYAAQASGQFLLNVSDPNTLVPFCLIAILSSLSVLPVAMTYIRAPVIHEPSTLSFKSLYRLSSSGIISSFSSGLILSPIYGLMPLYASQLNYSTADVALMMSLIIYGGMSLQYPVGRSSDFLGRRKILLFLLLSSALMAFVILSFGEQYRWILLTAAFFLGGVTFTIYPVSISMACDVLEKKDIVAATQGLLLAYGIGAAIGPEIASLTMNLLGPNGLLIYFMVVSCLIALFLAWPYRRALSIIIRRPFVALPRSTPIANQLDPRAEDKAK